MRNYQITLKNGRSLQAVSSDELLFTAILSTGKAKVYAHDQITRFGCIDDGEEVVNQTAPIEEKEEVMINVLPIYHFLKEVRNSEGGMEVVRYIATNMHHGEIQAYEESLRTKLPVRVNHPREESRVLMLALNTGNWEFALLKHRLANKGKDFRMLVADHGTIASINKMETWVNSSTFAWANASYGFFLTIKDSTVGWGLDDLGMEVVWGAKTSKRLQEVARITGWYHYTEDDTTIKLREFDGSRDVKLYDGMNFVSKSFALRMVNDPSTRYAIHKGKITRLNLRITFSGGLIKGDCMVVPGSWLSGADVVYHPENLKTEIKTDGWLMATAFEHHPYHIAVWDDQSMINNKKILTEKHQTFDLDYLVTELETKLEAGEMPKWITLIEDAHTNDGTPELDRQSDLMHQTYFRWQAHGLDIKASQNSVFTALGGIIKQMEASVKRNKMWMPMSNAFVGTVVTYDALRDMGNVRLPLDLEDIVFWDDRFGVVVPGQRFVETFDLHGTWDQDDTAKFILIKLWSSDDNTTEVHRGGFTIPYDMIVPDNADDAILVVAVIRSPNGPGEFSIEWMDLESMPFYNQDLDRVTVVDLATVALPQSELLGSVVVRGIPTSLEYTRTAFTAQNAKDMLAAQAINPGIGRTANLMMHWVNSFGPSFPMDMLAEIGAQVDATQQEADPVSFDAISADVTNVYEQFIRKLLNSDVKVDYYLTSMRMPKKYSRMIPTSKMVKGRLFKLYTRYNNTMATIRTRLQFKSLQMRQASELVTQVHGIRVGGDTKKWASSFYREYSNKLAGAGLATRNSADIRDLMGDPNDRNRRQARVFAELVIQRAKMEETQTIVSDMVDKLRSFEDDQDRMVIALYKWITLPKTGSPLGTYDRVIFQAGAKGQVTVMDLLIEALYNYNIITR